METKGKLIVVPEKNMPKHYMIKYDGHGTTPNCLKGLFSSRKVALKHVKAYEERPRPQPIKYTHQKNITDEEEAELFAEIEKKVDKENAERRKNNGKESKPKIKNKSGTELIRQGSDNGGEPSQLSA